MAQLQVSNDPKANPCTATHEWAVRTVMQIHNLASCLQSSQFDGVRVHIAQLRDSYRIREEQQDILDFTCFSLAFEEPVQVGGEYYKSYHAGVEELIEYVVSSIFSTLDLSRISNQDVKKINEEDIKSITNEFYNAICYARDEATDDLDKLRAQLAWEYDMVNRILTANHKETSDNTSDIGVVSSGMWWHDRSEPLPKEYKYGPIIGMQKDICQWMGEKETATPRRLGQKACSRAVWVIRQGNTSWEVWFKDERMFQLADNNRRFAPKSS